MCILYAFMDEKWGEFASFDDYSTYASQIQNAAKIKKETTPNAVVVMESFVLGKKAYDAKYGKLVKRALRHFDEVGLSNDIFDSLEELLDEGYEKFALAQAGDNVESFPQGTFDVQI